MAMDSCKNSDNVDFSLVPDFSKYYESVRNHHWMIFRPECKTHLFAYKAYVQGRREAEKEIALLKAELKRERESNDFYASGFAEKELEPKPEKSYLYDQDYPIGSEKWLMRSMSDYWSGKLARETKAQRKAVIE